MASLLIRGFALGFAIAASPGPIFFLCLRRALLRGPLVGLASGLGVATADGLYAAVAVFGIAAITGGLAGGAKWLALAGGVALIVLGLRSLLEQPREVESQPVITSGGLAWAYASTFGLTIANPATIVSFVAIAAALGSGLSGSFARPSVVVVGVALGSATWWGLVAATGSVLRAHVGPAVARAIGVVSGLAIAGLGLFAVVTAFGQ